MSGSFEEYTAYLNSHNREPKPITNNLVNDSNDTNDIIIPVRFPNRMNVAQISLASLELPLTQYNIEQDWQTLYMDEGIDLYVLEPSQEPLVQFSISQGGLTYTAQIPPRLNPVIQISDMGPTTSAIFTTQYPHCLTLSDFFNWGEPMKLINTPLVTNENQLSSSNTGLVILSDTEFQLTWSNPVTFQINPSGILGYVSTPSIPSPVYLADLVTLALGVAFGGTESSWNVSFNRCTGKYKLCFVGAICNLYDLTPVILLVPGTNSLPHIMGFGFVNMNITLTPPHVTNSSTALTLFDQAKGRDPPDINLLPNCIQSIDCSPCRTQVHIDVGNYSPELLMNNLSQQLNRFYFDPGCNMLASGGPVVTSNPITLVYSDACGLCYTVDIPFGMYDPDSLALYIQTAMQSQITTMQVLWDLNSGQFRFSAQTDFGLEFDRTSSLAARLGFSPVSLRNNNQYFSTLPIYYPTKGCCGTGIPERHLSYTYTTFVNGNQRKFIVEVSKTRSINNVGPITDNGDGTITITTQLSLGPPVINIAHGYQVLDVIEVSVGGLVYELTVTSVPAYNQFTAELGSVLAATFVGEDVCLELSGAITTNQYFTCVGNNVLARTLGYTECDALWDVSRPTTWIPPACFMLDWPQYVLVEMTQPTGATHNMHAWRTSVGHMNTHTQVLAKVILYPQFRMERAFPFRMSVPDLRIIERVEMRILNPDMSLYQLHGRDWSCTLTFTSVEKSLNALCY